MRIQISNSGEIFISALNALSGSVLTLRSGSFVLTGSLVHILVSFDLANNVGHLYVDDIDRASTEIYVDDLINWTSGQVYVGYDGGGFELDASLGQYWESRSYFEFSIEAERRKFITADLQPVDLGSDGSNPGVSPILYLNNPVPNFEVNLGTGGGMTEVGTLTDEGTYGGGLGANLTRIRNIIAPVQADAILVGNTKVTRNLARTIIARALINADLTAVTVHNLQANLLAEGLSVSNISVTKNLISNLIATGNLTADLAVSLVVDLQASLLAIANTSADVRLLRNLISSLLAEGSINSDLSVSKNLIVSLLAESFVNADVNVTRNLISNVLATANLVANTKVVRNLHMENAAFAFMTKADLKVDKKLQSNLLATVDIFASLGTLGTVDLMANLLTNANISADLRPFIGLNSSVSAVSNLIADITKSKDLNTNLFSTASLLADIEKVANLKITLFAFGNVNANLRRALLASILMEAIAEQYLTSSHKMRGQKILQTAVAEQYLDGITKLEQDDSLYSFPWNQDYIELLEKIDVNSPDYQHYLDQIQNANEIIERLREQNKRLRDLGG